MRLLIDKAELMRHIENEMREWGEEYDALQILGDIEDFPTVDPVKHGRWLHGREISRDYIGDTCMGIHYEKWWCSECDYRIDDQPLRGFCPNCGAKMEGVKNEAD